MSKSPPSVDGERLRVPRLVIRVFTDREYQPAWTQDGCPTPPAFDLLKAVESAADLGLSPDDYHRAILLKRLRNGSPGSFARPLSDDEAAQLEILLTDAFLNFAQHRLAGRTHLESGQGSWRAVQRKADLNERLNTAIETNDVPGVLASLDPPHSGYERLCRALAFLRARGHDWSRVPAGKILKKGDRGPRVRALRRRLSEEPGNEALRRSSSLYDAALVAAVKDFQGRMGLDADGRAGAGTIQALNVPIADRIQQIELNLDRWRWLPSELGRRYLIVNVPEFQLHAYADDALQFSMPVIVGRQEEGEEKAVFGTETPIFSNAITYLEFSPYWNVPRDIALADILPFVRTDKHYLENNHMEVLMGSGRNTRVLDTTNIDWYDITPRYLPLRFRQKPGPWNALGRVKFMFPNQYNVYIHGNPVQGLFARRQRMFSHGCVRVENPEQLALFVLNDPAWTPETLSQAMSLPEPKEVPLAVPVPVYLLYWTAWVDPEGRLHFRDDVYGMDKDMEDIIANGGKPPPRPPQ